MLSAELKLGRVLGRGGFCVVSEIESFQLKDEVITEEAKQNNLDLANQKHRRADLHDRVKKEGEARYAIKTLLPELKDDEEELEKGIIDLAIEAKFLCVLEHPHIIKMRGLCVGDMKIPGYFLVLDKLYDTFNQKLKKWKFAEKKLSGMMSKLKDKKGKKKNEFFAEKLNCAYDLASAVRFLHDNK